LQHANATNTKKNDYYKRLQHTSAIKKCNKHVQQTIATNKCNQPQTRLLQAEMLDYTVLIIAYVIFLIGAAGCFLPIIPGLPLIFFVFLGYGFYDHWHSYGLGTMIAVGLVAIGSIIIENLASAAGAKAFGSGKAGMIGSIVGAIVGVIFFSIIGLIIGTFIGAVIFEMIFNKKEIKDASKAGAGALLGCLGGSVFKFILSVMLIILFSYFIINSSSN
jgi:uncharacterized protein YqgC (DUF456 family)